MTTKFQAAVDAAKAEYQKQWESSSRAELAYLICGIMEKVIIPGLMSVPVLPTSDWHDHEIMNVGYLRERGERSYVGLWPGQHIYIVEGMVGKVDQKDLVARYSLTELRAIRDFLVSLVDEAPGVPSTPDDTGLPSLPYDVGGEQA